MPHIKLPEPVSRYFAAKGGLGVEDTLACFMDEATVWDNGEGLELRGLDAIRRWLAGTVSGYDLKSEVISAEERGDEFVAGVVVSGNFPGSPYKFENRFKLTGDKIAELVIDPIGSLAE